MHALLKIGPAQGCGFERKPAAIRMVDRFLYRYLAMDFALAL